jgi:hypothetical protein
MIETPVKPRPRPLAAPPPDPAERQAVPAPPPDAAALHDRACQHCGSALHRDQLACLNCGRMAEDGTGRVPWRTWGLASAATLLLVGGTVGAAIAGLPSGKHIQKPIASALAPKKAIPPATAGTATGGTSTTPLGGAGGSGTTTPPAVHTTKPKSTTPPPKTTTPSTSGGSNGGASTMPSTSNKKPAKKHHTTTTPGASSVLFADGTSPGRGGLFDPSGDTGDHQGDVINTYDNDAGTTWKSGDYPGGKLNKQGVGIWVKADSGAPSKGIGIFTRTPGFNVEIYATNDQGATTSPSLNAWGAPVAHRDSVSARQRVSLPTVARKDTYYLVWITKLPAGAKRVILQELQLLQ